MATPTLILTLTPTLILTISTVTLNCHSSPATLICHLSLLNCHSSPDTLT